MRKMILLAFIVSVVLISGCTSRDTAKNIYLSAQEKMENLNNIEIHVETSVEGGGLLGDIPEIKSVIYKFNDNMRIDTESLYSGVQSESRTYIINDNSYSCSRIFWSENYTGNWTCYESGSLFGDSDLESLSSKGLEEQRKNTEKMFNITGLEITEISQRDIIGRTCDYVGITMDEEVIKEYMKGQGLAGLFSTMFTNTIKDISSGSCFDREIGYPLLSESAITMKVDESEEMTTKTTIQVTEIKIGTVEESMIELPVPEDDVRGNIFTSLGE